MEITDVEQKRVKRLKTNEEHLRSAELYSHLLQYLSHMHNIPDDYA